MSNVVLVLSAEPCIVTIADMQSHNIALKHKRLQKMYVRHEDRLEFTCKRGRHLGQEMIRYCYDGRMDLPTCY